MSSSEFLNVAHSVLVEEFMRSRMVKGITIPGMSLEEALERAAVWAEGFGSLPRVESAEHEQQVEQQQQQQAAGQKSEEEMVAQNEVAMQALMGRMKTVAGGIKPANV